MDFKNQIDGLMDNMVKDIQGLIQIKSVEAPAEGNMPFGKGVQDALEYTLNLGEKMGFAVKNVDNYAGHIEFGEGDEIIGVLAHLDVVPEGSNWDYDPYGAEIADGKIFGRGTIDNKGPAVSALYAMKALKDEGIPVNKRVRLILGTNEETGWEGINYYMKNEETPHMGFTPDADFPAIHGEMGILIFDLVKKFEERLPDGGIEVLSINGGNAPNMVPDYAEAHLKVTKPIDHILEAYNKDKEANLEIEMNGDVTVIKSFGVSAHGSTPEHGKNAISYLMDFLNYVDLQIGDVTNFVRDYARLIGLDYNGQNIGCELEDEYGKLVFNVGVINFEENEGRVSINIRYPITETMENVYKGLEEALEFTNIKIEEHDHLGPIYLPPDHELITALMGTYSEVTGDHREPITIGGGTYARSMKNAVAFGPLFPGKEETAHQKNEFIEIEDLRTMTHIYANALYKLTR